MSETSDLTVREPTDLAPAGEVLMDFKAGMPLVSVEQQAEILEEYDKRREFFRKWLLSHLKEGVHYGYVPGCEVTLNADGDIVQKYKDKNTGKWETKIVSKRQWVSKPSLYKAGARLIVDLLPMRDVYESDKAAWEMMGCPAGTLVRTCTLLHTALTGQKLGEGTGAFRGPSAGKYGEKGMNENSAIKMADKRALVAAVVNTIPVVADLFTQDMEDKQDPARRAPTDDRPKATMDDGPETQEAPAERPPFGPTLLTNFCRRVAANRRGMDDLKNEDFIAKVCETEVGLADLNQLTEDQFWQVADAIGARQYDWATGDKFPEDEPGPREDEVQGASDV